MADRFRKKDTAHDGSEITKLGPNRWNVQNGEFGQLMTDTEIDALWQKTKEHRQKINTERNRLHRIDKEKFYEIAEHGSASLTTWSDAPPRIIVRPGGDRWVTIMVREEHNDHFECTIVYHNPPDKCPGVNTTIYTAIPSRGITQEELQIMLQ